MLNVEETLVEHPMLLVVNKKYIFGEMAISVGFFLSISVDAELFSCESRITTGGWQ